MEKLIKKLRVIEGILSGVWLQIHAMPHSWDSVMRMQKYFNKSIREVYLILSIQCFLWKNKCFQRRNKFSISWNAPFIQNNNMSICWYKQRYKMDPWGRLSGSQGQRGERTEELKEREILEKYAVLSWTFARESWLMKNEKLNRGNKDKGSATRNKLLAMWSI